MSSIDQQILETLSDAAGQYVWGVDKSFAKLCNSVSHPVTVATTDLEEDGPVFLFANDAFLKLCGYSFAEVVGKSPRVLHGEKTDKRRTARFRAELAEHGQARMKIVNYRRNGEEYGVDIFARRLSATAPHGDVMLAAEREISVSEAMA